MPDRKTVIDKLNDMADYLRNKSYSDLLARDFYDTVGYALAMLKKQEPVSPVLVGRMWECGACHAPVGIYLDDERDDYCRKCGKKVLWDE